MGRKVSIITLVAFIYLPSAHADWIDFEAQGANAPKMFTGTTDSPLVIASVTVAGGQLLKDELNGVDHTAVYATTNLVRGAYTNPLHITFSQPINTFNVLVTNNLADTYTVTDNLGGSQSYFLAANSRQTFVLLDFGITGVTVSSATAAAWDFAIDDVTAPEPSLFFPLAGALLYGCFLKCRRRYRARVPRSAPGRLSF